MAQISSVIGRILTPQGSPVGCGFVISRQHICTCAHVIGPGRSAPPPLIDIDFPWASRPNRIFQASVQLFVPLVKFSPVHRAQDIAILAFSEDLPEDFAPPPLLGGGDWKNHRFSAFGFPAGYPNGTSGSGTIQAEDGAGLFQLTSEPQRGLGVLQGFSGGPVWDETLQAVVGMIVRAEENPTTGDARMIPLSTIGQIWPPLRDSLRLPGQGPTIQPEAQSEPTVSIDAVRHYLSGFRNDMEKQNRYYLPLDAAEVPESHLNPVPADDISHTNYVRRVRQMIRMVSSVRLGGDYMNAQLAVVDRRSKVVRNIAQELHRTTEPLVLLGDPGTGKSMTLREVAKDLAARQMKSTTPLLPVYIRLGSFAVPSIPTQDDVLSLIRRTLPGELASALSALIRTHRLVVFFDGMDEMSRNRYGQYVTALSDFAGTYRDSIKTIFSCRINDFTPEFRHRQLVLLPFDNAQIKEFISSNVGKQTYLVDNRRVGFYEIYERAIGEEWIQTLRIPLFLYLFLFFVQIKLAWPASRKEVLDSFFEHKYADYARAPGTGPALSKEQAYSGWAKLAYELSIRNLGAAIAYSELVQSGIGQVDLDAIVSAGVRCGVLHEAELDEKAIRFDHHRYQEYFTAWYLDSNSGEFDWAQHLDEPRWQETLINLATHSRTSPAITALSQAVADGTSEFRVRTETHRRGARLAMSLAQAYGPDLAASATQETATRERQFADRVDFAARVVRAFTERSESLVGELSQRCVAAVEALLKKGNPITQVKALWAGMNLPNIDMNTLFEGPMHSPVFWVRRQALILLASRSSMLPSHTSFAYELGIDLASGAFLSRAGAYWSAARKASGWRPLWCLVWSWFCFAIPPLIFFCAYLICYVIFGLQMREQIHFAAISRLFVFGLWILPILILATTVFVLSFRGKQTLSLVLVANAIALLVILFLNSEIRDPKLDVTFLVTIVFSSFLLVGLAVILDLIAQIFSAVVYILGTFPMARTKSSVGNILLATLETPAMEWGVVPAGAVALGGLGGGAVVLFSRPLAITIVFLSHTIDTVGNVIPLPFSPGWNILVALALVVVAIGTLFSWRGTEPADPFWPRLLKAAAGPLGVALALLSYCLIFWLFPRLLGFLSGVFHIGVSLMQYIVATVLVLAILAAVTFVVWAVLRATRERLRSWNASRERQMPLSVWASDLKKQNPFLQAQILRRTHYDQFGVSPYQFWQTLAALQPHMEDDPAATAYWQKRDEIERILRQGEIEAPGGA